MIEKSKIQFVYRLLIVLGMTLLVASVCFLIAGSGFGWTIQGTQRSLGLLFSCVLLYAFGVIFTYCIGQKDRKKLMQVSVFVCTAVVIDLILYVFCNDFLKTIALVIFTMLMIYYFSKYGHLPGYRIHNLIVVCGFLFIALIHCWSFSADRNFTSETFRLIIDRHLLKLILCWLLALEGGIAIGVSWRIRSYIVDKKHHNAFTSEHMAVFHD